MNTAETLRELEEQLLDSSIRKNAEAISSLLAEDFQEFGSSGRVFSKPEIIATLQTESPARLSLGHFHAQLLANNIALITYRSRREEPGMPAIETLRNSIWVVRDGHWRLLFHQGTRALESPANDTQLRNEP
ncbi:hypothetical protein ACPOL_2006 [Acidisarcina polymorpha]|uniref:DUF4440 domain-containing protein n=1 Tax=Acidisarcina polymorpha TaxID=2211140 RepID=A0A2Z5FX45_9BACT|nr:nuclear transport factor 2 family protein [Acidisarcina polymorpha]AXC11342.1 hypothetical protein ACPOL_2006 [Acidisarcina polymorpha]